MDKIICVGKNYLKHALELGDAVPEEPLFFLKPPSTLVEAGTGSLDVEWPSGGELHHEVELVLRLTRASHGWTFSHYTIGLDMTLRDVQNRLKKAGQPWEKAKSFFNSAVIGRWQAFSDLETVLNQTFSLKVNGRTRQETRGQEMRWKPAELLASLEPWLTLSEGDLLFTGTPDGVGPVNDGDVLEVRGEGVEYSLRCRRVTR